ncbi:MAG TPA: isocitrate lyase/phosphoenolpyruvate mutase family protein [Streptosporangiales bacterium]
MTVTLTFHDLHHGDAPLLLPNAWDVASALAFVEAGFPAVGTTSFGVAAAAGRPDAGRGTREANLVLARALSRLPVHVSVDIEDGYDDDPLNVAEFVADLGVAGVNIEDSTAEQLVVPGAHAAKVAAIKRHVPDVFVNARVDTYWLGQDATVAATLTRARAYVDAGADGVFVPGVTDPAEIRALADDIAVPVNVLVVPGRSLDELAALGVRRVSTGSLPYRAAITAAVRVATAVRDAGAVPEAAPYPEMQERLVRYAGQNG